ncbi:fimbrial biogenesis chaperone [Neisseria zalophi]|uniref:Molecular chaperone n=1 Tax=Neisseria zalophi TaxID=640030 RepID=A0A5J6PYG5_9NEIS|nr:molecular chaperone [Neisseria zalophi]QEY25897.1 molecular chaperone [Neisseria zalophi]
MQWSKLKPVLTGIALSAFAFGSHAAGLQISPTGLSLPAKQRAGIFTLTNTDSAPLTAQVRVYRWTQDENGQDVLTPTRDVIASPPMVKLAAGGVQQFRVIRAQPAKAAEEAYRLVVDELPAPDKQPQKGLQFVLRYSVPLFLNQSEDPNTQLQWEAEASGGKVILKAKNIGAAHAQLSHIVFNRAADNTDKNLVAGLAGYILPGKTGQYTLDISPAALRQGQLSVTVNGRPTRPEVRFAAP